MKRSSLLPVLWGFQQKHGYISNNTITEIAKKLNVSKIEIEGVVTFYHFLHSKPTGKYIIYLNNSIVSEFKGFNQVKSAFEKETGGTFGIYDKNPMFSLFETSCIGLSDKEPAALINSSPFTNLTPKKVSSLINHLKGGGKLTDIEDNPTSKIQYKPTEDKTIFFRNYSLGNTITKLKHLKPNEVLKEIEKADVSGRGGAFFPTATKWQYSKNSATNKKYIICNADEGEPGTFKDKALLNYAPGLVLEGMVTAAYVSGAQKGIIYLRAEYNYLVPKIEKIINKFYSNGFLGKNIANIKNFNFDIEVFLGAGAYVCGAETALIESLEGKRGEPRIRKYFPTHIGYNNKSTIVNNVETLALAARVIELGSNFFQKIGTSKSKGTKLLSVSGDVAKPGIYEVEWGTSINQLISMEMAQATAPNYVQISGPSGECINKNEFHRKISKEDLACGGSIMIFNKYRSIIQIIENFTHFFKTESCGSCTPCRAGNQILIEKIKKIKKGIASSEDLNQIKELGEIMKLTSRCGLGQYAANTFISAIDKFQEYFNLKVFVCEEDCNIEFDMEAAVFEYDNIIQSTQN